MNTAFRLAPDDAAADAAAAAAAPAPAASPELQAMQQLLRGMHL
jgi:hypothetical protein